MWEKKKSKNVYPYLLVFVEGYRIQEVKGSKRNGVVVMGWWKKMTGARLLETCECIIYAKDKFKRLMGKKNNEVK